MDPFTHRTYRLTMSVAAGETFIDLGHVEAQLPAELAGMPPELLDAFAEMLRAGADRLEPRRVLSSCFHSSRNGRARSIDPLTHVVVDRSKQPSRRSCGHLEGYSSGQRERPVKASP